MRPFSTKSAGSNLSRSLLPKMLFCVVVTGLLIQQLYGYGFLTTHSAILVSSLVFSFIAAILILTTSKKLDNLDNQRKVAEHLTISLNEDLEKRVKEKTDEWEQAYVELQNQKELFLTLFRNGPVAKVLSTINTGVIVDCSDAYFQTFGFNRDDIIGKTAKEFGIISDLQHKSKTTGQPDSSNTITIEDYQLRNKDGDLIWITTYISTVILNGEAHLLTTMLDFTERKKIEESYKYILQNATDIIYTTDSNGNFDFINESVTPFIGYTPSELTGKHFTSLVHPDFRREAIRFYLKQFSENINHTYFEFKIIDKNTVVKWIGQNVKIKKDPQGNSAGFLAVSRDITERKNLEIDLQLKNERLEEAMQIAKFGYFEHDLTTNKITRSKELFEIFEIDNAAFFLDKESYLNFLMPDSVAEFAKHLEKLTVLKKQSSIEYQIKTLKGNLKHIFTNARPILDKQGNVILVRGTTQDITDRKYVESELRKAKELSEQSVKIKDRFLANMTHEIRTPMNAILGFSGILNESPLNTKQKEWLKTIISSGESLLVLLNDLLDFSKIGAGMIQIENLPVSLDQELESILKLNEIKPGEKNIELRFEIEGTLPELVFSDPFRLRQILTNLISNAVKFTNKGFVKLATTILNETETDIAIEFRVIDSGIGISEEQSKYIFDRFTQASSETTRIYGGSGLGLSIVKELTLLLNGKIELFSRLNAGSEFILTLPFKKCTRQQIEEYKKQSQKEDLDDNLRLDRLDVLLVEDNRINQQFVVALMDDFGFTTVLANNGKEAVQKMKDRTFDIVLMDMQMPIMDGVEATRVIRNSKDTTPIIALTANAMINERDKCFEAGMDDYATKPIITSELYQKMKRLVPHKLISAASLREDVTARMRLGSPFNSKELMEILNGDKDGLKELIFVFLEDTPKDVEKLSLAIKKEDYKSIEQFSHKLVSSFSVMCATEAADILREMEGMAETTSSIREIRKLFEQFLGIFSQIKADLKKL